MVGYEWLLIVVVPFVFLALLPPLPSLFRRSEPALRSDLASNDAWNSSVPRPVKILHQIPWYEGGGFCNSLSGLADSIILSELFNRCIEIEKIHMFERYYDTSKVNLCSKHYSRAEILPKLLQGVGYKHKDICRDLRRIELPEVLVHRGFWMCISNCAKHRRYDALVSEVRPPTGVSRRASSDQILYYHTLAILLPIRPKWLRKIPVMYPDLRRGYNASHFRTFGFFKDLKENVEIRNVDVGLITRTIRAYTDSRASQMFLSTDSTRLRAIVKEALPDRVSRFVFNDDNMTHSYFKDNEFDPFTIIDIEVLAASDYLLFTPHSSYSRAAFFKNPNCLRGHCLQLDIFGYEVWRNYCGTQKL